MKRISALFLAGLLSAGLLSGCREVPEPESSLPPETTADAQLPPQTTAPTTPSTEAQTSTPPTEPEADALTLLRQEIADAQCEAGLAFLGYVGYDSTREEVEAFVAQGPLAEKYPFLTQAPVVLAPGQELYALIPGKESQSLQVYPSGISLEGEYEDDRNTLLFDGEPGQILLLRCNESEVFSNVLVSLFGGTDILEFRPSVSLKDGHLAALPGVYDFSLYEDDEAPSVSEAMALLLTAPEIQEGIDLGLTLMYTGESQWIEGKSCLVFVLGAQLDGNFAREIYYAVGDGILFVYNSIDDVWTAMEMG